MENKKLNHIYELLKSYHHLLKFDRLLTSDNDIEDSKKLFNDNQKLKNIYKKSIKDYINNNGELNNIDIHYIIDKMDKHINYCKKLIKQQYN